MKKYRIRQSTQNSISLKQDCRIDGRYYVLDQKHDSLQCLFGCLCEGQNTYLLSQSDPNFNVQNRKGSIQEESGCLPRMFCLCNRAFITKMKLYDQDFSYSQRSCNCNIGCIGCGTDELVVIGRDQNVIGSLRAGNGCSQGHYTGCADMRIEIVDEKKESLFFIQGDYCQYGIQFPFLRCLYFPTIEYSIYDKCLKKVGKIMNLYNGCFRQFFTRTSKFGVELPTGSEDNHKMLLLYAALFLDYLKYDTPCFCFGIR